MKNIQVKWIIKSSKRFILQQNKYKTKQVAAKIRHIPILSMGRQYIESRHTMRPEIIIHIGKAP